MGVDSLEKFNDLSRREFEEYLSSVVMANPTFPTIYRDWEISGQKRRELLSTVYVPERTGFQICYGKIAGDGRNRYFTMYPVDSGNIAGTWEISGTLGVGTLA